MLNIFNRIRSSHTIKVVKPLTSYTSFKSLPGLGPYNWFSSTQNVEPKQTVNSDDEEANLENEIPFEDLIEKRISNFDLFDIEKEKESLYLAFKESKKPQ